MFAAHAERVGEEFEIGIEGVVPAAPLPSDRPTTRAVRARDRLDDHARLVNRPLAHRLRASGVFGDEGLEYDEAETGLRILSDLRDVERKLARAFAERVLDGQPTIFAAQIEAIARAHIIFKRQR